MDAWVKKHVILEEIAAIMFGSFSIYHPKTAASQYFHAALAVLHGYKPKRAFSATQTLHMNL